MKAIIHYAGALTLILCGACGGPRESEAGTAATVAADRFMARIAEHCGQAYGGHIAANEPPADDDPFAGQILVMHVRDCGDGELRIPFHVGDDHSRVWILTRTDAGLRLKHDHRHKDGSDDQRLGDGNRTRRTFRLRTGAPGDRAPVPGRVRPHDARCGAAAGLVIACSHLRICEGRRFAHLTSIRSSPTITSPL